MHVFRITKTLYSWDLSGTGARLHGGRWNPKGISVVYTAESRALATVEYLVHVPLSLIPRDLQMVTVHIPDWITPKTIAMADLLPTGGTIPHHRNWRRSACNGAARRRRWRCVCPRQWWSRSGMYC